MFRDAVGTSGEVFSDLKWERKGPDQVPPLIREVPHGLLSSSHPAPVAGTTHSNLQFAVLFSPQPDPSALESCSLQKQSQTCEKDRNQSLLNQRVDSEGFFLLWVRRADITWANENHPLKLVVSKASRRFRCTAPIEVNGSHTSKSPTAALSAIK